MKKICHIYFLLAVLMSFSCSGGKSSDSSGEVRIDTMQQILSIRKCSRLYTAEYVVSKIVLKDDAVKLKGNIFRHKFDVPVPMGERKILIPIDVTLKAYIDFGGFSEENVMIDGERITVILPDPKVIVTSSKIDHREVKSFVDFARTEFTSSERYELARQGVESVLKTVPELGIVETARESAVNMIVPVLAGLGYKEENITISFSDTFLKRKYPEIFDSEGKTIKIR